ncbi:MAG TPA: 2-succinyl-6-hydroxy-2,4-cyclohexadiene-1-carboxylate synthase, partial [Coleofasciculaceae cyanobacterium]
SPGLKTKGDRLERMKHDFELAKRLETTDFSSFISNWYEQPLFASLKNYSDFELMKLRRLQNNPLELAKSLRNLSTGCQPSLWDNLHQNRTPLLLLVGEYDDKFRAINAEIAQHCKSAQLEIICDSGHNIHLENPNAWVDKVSFFLRENSHAN